MMDVPPRGVDSFSFHYPMNTQYTAHSVRSIYDPVFINHMAPVDTEPQPSLKCMQNRGSLKVGHENQLSSEVENEAELLNVKNREKFCRHYFLGYCERGKSCRFKHRVRCTAEHSGIVFICGLPPHFTKVQLKNELTKMGFNVLLVSLKEHKSWPLVRLESPDEAEALLKKGTVSICGSNVEIRSHQAVAKKQMAKVALITKRSVFLGGLKKGTTARKVRDSLKSIGVKVVNLIEIKRGFCPKVTLATLEQAQMLISKGKIIINGSETDVRPYRPATALINSLEANT